MGPKFFFVVQNFLWWTISWFSVAGRMRKSDIEIYLKLRILFQIDFNNWEFLTCKRNIKVIAKLEHGSITRLLTKNIIL